MFFESSSDGFIFVHKKTESTFSGCLKNSYKTKKVITHLLLTFRIRKVSNKKRLKKPVIYYKIKRANRTKSANAHDLRRIKKWQRSQQANLEMA